MSDWSYSSIKKFIKFGNNIINIDDIKAVKQDVGYIDIYYDGAKVTFLVDNPSNLVDDIFAAMEAK